MSKDNRVCDQTERDYHQDVLHKAQQHGRKWLQANGGPNILFMSGQNQWQVKPESHLT